MPDIPRADRRAIRSRLHSIIRGESRPLQIQTTYTGPLAPFDEPVLFTARNADPIKVWGTNALQIIADVDAEVFRALPVPSAGLASDVTDTTANATDVYNPTVELLREGTPNFFLLAEQQLEFGTSTIQPGQDLVHALLRSSHRTTASSTWMPPTSRRTPAPSREAPRDAGHRAPPRPRPATYPGSSSQV